MKLDPDKGMPVPRRTRVLLSDETVVNATVVGRVRDRRAYVKGDEDDEGGPKYAVLRTVRVHIDGEPFPRPVDWTRLEEFKSWR